MDIEDEDWGAADPFSKVLCVEYVCVCVCVCVYAWILRMKIGARQILSHRYYV
jgi:hypothetical protein